MAVPPKHSIYAYIDPQNHPNVGKYAIHGVSGPWRVWELTLQIQAPDPEIRDVLLEGLGLRRRGTNTDDAPDPDQTNGTEILIHLPHFMTPM